MNSRSQKSTTVVLEERAGCIGDSLPEAVHQIGVGEHVSATAGHFMKACCEVHLGFNLLDTCEGYHIVLVTGLLVHGEVAQHRVKDENPSQCEACLVVVAGVNEVRMRRLIGTCQEESDIQGRETFAEGLIIEC